MKKRKSWKPSWRDPKWSRTWRRWRENEKKAISLKAATNAFRVIWLPKTKKRCVQTQQFSPDILQFLLCNTNKLKEAGIVRFYRGTIAQRLVGWVGNNTEEHFDKYCISFKHVSLISTMKQKIGNFYTMPLWKIEYLSTSCFIVLEQYLSFSTRFKLQKPDESNSLDFEDWF